MERDESNDDFFSSFSIHQSNIEIETDPLISEEIGHRQKLKARRKKNQRVDGSSSTSVSRFKLKVKYDGCFRPIKNGSKEIYCLGRQKTIYLDQRSYSFAELFEEVSGFYHLDENLQLSLFFLDKRASTQSYIQLEDDDSYGLLLTMYEEKKEVVIYATKEKIVVPEDGGIRKDGSMLKILEVENAELINYEEGSDYCHSEDSYHSHHSDTENEDKEENDFAYEGEFYSYNKDDPKIEIGVVFSHVVTLRRALNHYAVDVSLLDL